MEAQEKEKEEEEKEEEEGEEEEEGGSEEEERLVWCPLSPSLSLSRLRQRRPLPGSGTQVVIGRGTSGGRGQSRAQSCMFQRLS